MLEKYEAIALLITEFCEEYLNDEYTTVSLLMLEKLCRKRPSPLLSGKHNTWACGIIYAVGSNNFLFDRSQSPHMRASELAERFGISQSAAGNKVGNIKKLLNIGVFEPEWTLPSRLGENPLIWMYQTRSGFILDARSAPRDIQEDLFEAGMIPYIPADRADVEEDSEELKEKEDANKSNKSDTIKKKSVQNAIEGQFSFFSDKPLPVTDATEPSAKMSQPIKHIDETKSVQPLNTIEDYCENNRDFKKILEKFSDGYIQVYNKRKAAFRDEVKIYIKRNFNTWYYSEMNNVFPVSPARFINSDIYCKFGADAVVFPVCKPVFNKSKIADIIYSFHVFKLDDHPFIKDMLLFLESARSIRIKPGQGEAFDSIFTYAISIFSHITENAEFTFNERPYIIALSDVCERMSLISLSDTQDGLVYNDDKIAAFFTMTGREKLKRVVDVLIKRFVECIIDLKTSGLKPNTEDVLRVLQEEHELESFIDSLFGGIIFDLVNGAEMLLEEGHDPHALVESLDEEKLKLVLEVQSIISVCCSHFFSAFGQYLQMILPESDNPYIFSTSDDEYLEELEHEENSDDPYFKMRTGAMVYYIPPGGYCLTPLGSDWFGIDLSVQDDRLYPLILPHYYREVLDGMMEDDLDVAVDDFMRKVLSDPEQADNVDSLLESFFNIGESMTKTQRVSNPLSGLNPDGLPVFTDENATYRFRVGRCIIELDGTDTLSDLSRAIQVEFDLDSEHLSSFYMGKKFFEPSREIRCPRLDFFGDDDPVESDGYMICQLNLYQKQKFLYLNDFGSENRFTVTFIGVL